MINRCYKNDYGDFDCLQGSNRDAEKRTRQHHVQLTSIMARLICQKCRTPLKLDGTLQDLNPASFKILADAAPSISPKAPGAPRSAAAKERRQQYDEASQHAGAPVHKRRVSTGQKGQDRMKPDMSYIMLTESQFGPEKQDDHSSSKLAPPAVNKANGKSDDTLVT